MSSSSREKADETVNNAPAYDQASKEAADEKPKTSADRRKSSVVNPEIIQGQIFDERYDKTQRGLKSRHCQMIALGKSCIYTENCSMDRR
jgi:yeast amino acid transporter